MSLIGTFWKLGHHVIGVQAQSLFLTMKLSFFVSTPRRAQSSTTLNLLSTLPLVAASYSLNPWSLRIMFRATSRLLACRVTFFTRTPCGLCDTAKAVVQNVKSKRPLEYHEINVMDPGQERWKSLYEFDTPVVRRPGLPHLYMYAMRRVPECSNRSTLTRPGLERLLNPRPS